METPALPLTGGCGCGAVRFEVAAPFVSAGWCHCTRCRRRTGTGGSVQGHAPPGAFRIVAGEEHLRAWSPEGGAEKVFCGLCGSSLFSRTAGEPPRIGVRLGALDADPGIRPQYRQWVGSAASWLELPDDGLPRFEGARSG